MLQLVIEYIHLCKRMCNAECNICVFCGDKDHFCLQVVDRYYYVIAGACCGSKAELDTAGSYSHLRRVTDVTSSTHHIR